MGWGNANQQTDFIAEMETELMLALYLFGPPRLEMDECRCISRAERRWLYWPIWLLGQAHSRDSLATLLWPENDQSSARAELRRTLSVLKRTLGDGWLVADRETARLKTENDSLTEQRILAGCG